VRAQSRRAAFDADGVALAELAQAPRASQAAAQPGYHQRKPGGSALLHQARLRPTAKGRLGFTTHDMTIDLY
jgi:hypothetical protein